MEDTEDRGRFLATCYHEAGHAVAAMFLEIPLVDLEVVVNSANDAETVLKYTQDTKITQEFVRKSAAGKLAGPAAECRHLNTICDEDVLRSNYRFAEDRCQAERILQSYLACSGCVGAYRLGELLDRSTEEARAIVCDRWVEIVKIGEELLHKRHLSYEQIKNLLGVS